MATTIDAPTVQRLQRSWEGPSGFRGVISTVDHKTIGKRYLVTAFVFLILGGLEASAMRAQLALPNEHMLSPEQYNQLFSVHGVTMIFLYAAPILSGFSNYIWPLMLGSRDMAFPRLNALSYWIFLGAGIFIYSSVLVGQMPNAGWFDYVPYAERAYDPARNIDFYALGSHPARRFDDSRIGELHSHAVQDASAWHVAQPAADHRVGDAHSFVRQSLRAAVAHRRAHLPLLRSAFRDALLRSAVRADIRCSGSTCSGSSATHGST